MCFFMFFFLSSTMDFSFLPFPNIIGSKISLIHKSTHLCRQVPSIEVIHMDEQYTSLFPEGITLHSFTKILFSYSRQITGSCFMTEIIFKNVHLQCNYSS